MKLATSPLPPLDSITHDRWRALLGACERAYPNEACGWITIAADARVREATTGGRDTFAFSDDDLLAFVRASRSTTPPWALFHSHPDGDSEMSTVDRAALALHPLPHVIVAVAGGRARAATLYAWRDGAHDPVARWNAATPGAAATWRRA
ncbi:MAG TPA: Mov34/MPN/PAD-1 family protein [Kofleriaceae bacterium]|nr:Mov34/MPN/PAD-1 family protein [Kofleriaceae bacterium]